MDKTKNSKGKQYWSILLLCSLIFCLGIGIAYGDSGEPLFTELTDETPFSSDVQSRLDMENQSPKSLRSRNMQLNLNALSKLERGRTKWAESIVLNLFNDVRLTTHKDRVERRSTGSVSWFGRIDGVDAGQAILVVRDGDITGNVRYDGNLIEIRPLANGIHIIKEIDLSAFPEDDCATRYDDTKPESFLVPDVPEVLDDASTIDVMTVYTPAARSAAGGTTQMNDLIQLAVDETNQSYANSGITQRVRLVHTAEVSYTEPGGSCSIYDYRNRLQDPGDGHMDVVHTLRNTYCADLVVLIVENGCGYCGVAYIMESVSTGFEDHGFCVVARDCATGYFSFGHEMGHLMSARHDWFVDPTNNSPFTYNHGYVDPGDDWRTVMAYGNACSGCTRIQYWSNPDVLYLGEPMGIAEGQPDAADNRKTLNNTAWTVANFRQSCYQVELPDLVVESIVFTPEVPEAGQSVNVSVTVRNVGLANAGGFYLDWYANRDTPPQPEKTEFGDRWVYISSLAAGASYTFNTTYTYSQPGFYRMYAFADTEFQVEEAEETNNELGPLYIMVGPCGCDLNNDKVCDMSDYFIFGQDWGRTDCFQPAADLTADLVSDDDTPTGFAEAKPSTAPATGRRKVNQTLEEGAQPSVAVPVVGNAKAVKGGDVDDKLQVPKADAERIWQRLDMLDPAGKQNAALQLEAAADVPDDMLAEIRKSEALWNSGNFSAAVDILKDLEAAGVALAAGIGWKTPKAMDGLDWSEGDVRVGTRADIVETHLDFDAETGNLFAVLRYRADPNYHWSVNISENNGASWSETYEWFASYEIKDTSAVVVDDYLYVGYVGAADFSEARIRRFMVASGGVDNVYGYRVVFDKSVAINEISLSSNADQGNSRLYYYAILADKRLIWHWTDQDGGIGYWSWTEQNTGVEDAYRGLDSAWNTGSTTGNLLIASYVGYVDSGGTISYPVIFLRYDNANWEEIELVASYRGGTSVSGFGDNLFCAYEQSNGIRYSVSYNGGDTWSAGSFLAPAGEIFANPAVTARGGQGSAIVYDIEAGAFDPVQFLYRSYYGPAHGMTR